MLLTWQGLDRNEWITSFLAALAAGRDLPLPPPDRPGPFALSDADRVRGLLGPAGFDEVVVEPLERSTYFGRNAADAQAFLLGELGWLLEGLDGAARERALADFRSSLEAHETPHGVAYRSAAWLTTARRPG